MTRNVLAEDETGAIVSYEETLEERSARITEWAEQVAGAIDISPQQAALLRRLRGTSPTARRATSA